VLFFYVLKKRPPTIKEKKVKKIVLLLSVLIIVLVSVSCTKPDYKKITDDFIKASTPLKDYTIREVADTSSPNWKAVIVYVKRDRANMPIPFFVSSDGKSIVPNSLGKIDFKLTEKDRIVYNPSGKKTVCMFTDPDCPYCLKAKEKLKSYNGEYKVVVKYFPLEQIHPGATQKAIEEVAAWLKKTRTDLKGSDIPKEAKRMVEEDIAEGQKAGIGGVPTYIMEDGTLKQGLF